MTSIPSIYTFEPRPLQIDSSLIECQWPSRGTIKISGGLEERNMVYPQQQVNNELAY